MISDAKTTIDARTRRLVDRVRIDADVVLCPAAHTVGARRSVGRCVGATIHRVAAAWCCGVGGASSTRGCRRATTRSTSQIKRRRDERSACCLASRLHFPVAAAAAVVDTHRLDTGCSSCGRPRRPRGRRTQSSRTDRCRSPTSAASGGGGDIRRSARDDDDQTTARHRRWPSARTGGQRIVQLAG